VSSSLSKRVLVSLLALAPSLAPLPALAAAGRLTVLTPTQRREVATVARPEGELVAIEEVLVGFGVTATSDARGGAVTLQRGSRELVLHHRKSLASVDGDLKLLSAPAALEGGRWLVPLDSLPRLLGPFLEKAVEWRAAPRILLVGPVSIPRLSVSTFVSAELVRVVFEANETLPFRVQQETGRVTVAVPRDLVDVSLPAARLAGGIVESVQFLGGPENLFAVHLGPRFQTLKATEQESPARLVLEFSGPPSAGREAPPAPAARHARPAEKRRWTVVIDPRHGEATSGQGRRTLEKDVALSIARRLRAELVNARGSRSS
jgi:N-acetylmuramoyl-L-alanine amidase